MKIAFLLYPVSKVNIQEDSSFWIMYELQNRGHEVCYFESKDLFWSTRSGPCAYLTPARLDLKLGYLASQPGSSPSPLSSAQCIFIRKEPPFDEEYLYALQMLDTIKEKVFILNDPAGIATSNEKLFALEFAPFCPETLVSQSPREARAFIKALGGRAVLKPLHDKGGRGIFVSHSKDRNLPSLLESATLHGSRKIIVQRYLPADSHGDKRIVLLNGKPLGAFLRIPPAHDFRANLSTGGTLHKTALTARERKLVRLMAPRLLRKGLYFVGIDVIGGFLTEVNVTSPAGIPEVNELNGTRLERNVADFIEANAKRK